MYRNSKHYEISDTSYARDFLMHLVPLIIIFSHFKKWLRFSAYLSIGDRKLATNISQPNSAIPSTIPDVNLTNPVLINHHPISRQSLTLNIILLMHDLTTQPHTHISRTKILCHTLLHPNTGDTS
jgi:hypothetical protein